MREAIRRWLRHWLGVNDRPPFDEVTAFVRGEPGPWDEPTPEPEPTGPRRQSLIVELAPYEVPVFSVRTLGMWNGKAS